MAESALLSDINEAIEFFRKAGFDVEYIFPADDPREARIVGNGTRIFMYYRESPDEKLLRLDVSPLDHAEPPAGVNEREPVKFDSKELELTFTRNGDGADWIDGRAGMKYRDLIPGRQGGAVIASHIHIPSGGPVADYVHYHQVGFQLIYVLSGWVRVVYEGQGEPFVMNKGDAVLQPPGIRHRVLECSENLEVFEFSSPAEHSTYGDREMQLPGGRELDRYGGQKFVRHEAAVSRFDESDGISKQDLGIREATNSTASAFFCRCPNALEVTLPVEEFNLTTVLVTGGIGDFFVGEDKLLECGAGDAISIPGKSEVRIQNSKQLEFLLVGISF